MDLVAGSPTHSMGSPSSVIGITVGCRVLFLARCLSVSLLQSPSLFVSFSVSLSLPVSLAVALSLCVSFCTFYVSMSVSAPSLASRHLI